MGKKEKIAKLRQDKFYRLAKETGYRSRAAFKLIQLNRKYGFLNEARVVVDLCAAPGGWLQVVANSLPISSIIVGVDLVPIKAIRNVITHIGDITTDSCYKKIQNELKTWKADVVLHDGAPNLGQSWLADSFGQAKLTLSAIKLATELLSPHGWFITKIFRSKDYINLLNLLSSLFKHVHSTKPIASRRESAEIFVVCQDFVGLKGFESAILNFKTVFKEAEIVKPPLTLKKLIFKKKPNRSGYEDDAAPLIYRRRSVSEFLSTEHPIEFLSETNEIYIDKDSFNPTTITPIEVKEYLKDVRVLGLREVKALLLWRKKTIRIFGLNLKNLNNEISKSPEPEDNNEEDDINDAKAYESRDAKKEAKKKRKIERLYKARSKNSATQISSTIDDNLDHELFSLSSLKNISHLNNLLKCDKIFDDEEIIKKKPKKAQDSEDEIDVEKIKKLDTKISKIQLESRKRNTSNPLVSFGACDSDSSQNDEINSAAEADIKFLLGTKCKKSKVSKTKELKIETKERTILTPEELALGQHIRESSKNKKDLIDHSWNRHVRVENESLPSWFKMYEDIHTVRELPITKEQVEFYRQKQRELDAQPIKKVLEARARKKKKKIRLLESTKAKAQKLLQGEGALETDKLDQVKNLYKKANKVMKTKVKRKLLVAKKSLSTGRRYKKPEGIKGPVKVVDPRMKKDKRNESLFKKSKKRSKSRMRSRR